MSNCSQESVELPLTDPEYYEEMGIKPPKGVILYGAPGTGGLCLNLFLSCFKTQIEIKMKILYSQ